MFQRHRVNPLVLCLALLAGPFLSSVWLGPSRSVAQSALDPDHAQKMEAGIELFKSDVRTTLVGRCLKCHGGEKTESDFNLATREGMIQGGATGKAIDFSVPESSLLVKMIRHTVEPVMPEEGAKLDERQIVAIEKWIRLGAPYARPLIEQSDSDPSAWTKKTIDSEARDFWAFQSLRKDSPPILADESWCKNDVDRFVLDKLLENKLLPNAKALPATLLRRASLDLLGLPPTAEQVQAILTDESEISWERRVDELLASEHYGERFARHWLDLARFAESFGFEQDYDRPHAYHYRDFVIRAFNQDMPFDQFAAWQIAGDELQPQQPDARMATGFLGAGVFPTQLTEKEFESARYDELDDMVATLSTTFLGLTVGCARCHDHKFDPIPSRDYYQLISVFRNAIRGNVEIPLDPVGDQARIEKWEQEHAMLVAERTRFEENELPPRFDQMLSALRKKEDVSSNQTGLATGWRLPAATRMTSEAGATMTRQQDGSYLVSGTNADKDRYSCVLETLSKTITGIRLDAFNDPSLPQGGPGRATNGNIGLSRIRVEAQPLDDSSPPIEVKLVSATSTFEQNKSNLSLASTLDEDEKTGWAIDPQMNKAHSAAFQFATPITHPSGIRLTIQLDFRVNKQHNIGRPRISITKTEALPALESMVQDPLSSELQTLLKRDDSRLLEYERSLLVALTKTQDARWQELDKMVSDHLSLKPKPRLVTAMVCGEGISPIPNHGDGRGYPHFYPKSYFLKRGDTQQKQGEAESGFLQVLTRPISNSVATKAPLSNGANEQIDWSRWQVDSHGESKSSFRRAAFANWIKDTETGAGQQLARVLVNRIWQHHFGQGIVATPNDFGFQGERPTHPELLDWLARKLIDGGWRIKPIHKLIMMSATYQQSSLFDANKSMVDPKNQWVWRFSPRRLEAEVIRDSILATSGQLDRTLFGAGTLDESMKRRSIYFFVKRSQLIPFMQVFDSPEPLVGVGQRPSTTIAPQALMFMNNSHVRSWARSFAKKVIASHPNSIEQQMEYAYRVALARVPSADELAQAIAFTQKQLSSYSSDRLADPMESSIADFCQVLISLNEFIYLD